MRYLRSCVTFMYNRIERGVIMDSLGLAFIAAAGYWYAVWLGLILTGIGILVLNWRVD